MHMGRILPFAPRILRGYPTTTTALDPAESVFLLALRWWVADIRQWVDPMPRLRQAMTMAGVHDAAESVDRFMCVIARTAQRQIEMHAPRCSCLSADELRLVHAARLAQGGDTALAASQLGVGLMPGAAADFALGPLSGMGVLFRRAGLQFPHRAAPEAPPDRTADDRTPPAPSSLH
jgi:hypothetical protein